MRYVSFSRLNRRIGDDLGGAADEKEVCACVEKFPKYQSEFPIMISFGKRSSVSRAVPSKKRNNSGDRGRGGGGGEREEGAVHVGG